MQKVDLYQPLLHNREGHPPLTLRVGVTSSSYMVEGGSPETHIKSEIYILLSALPIELREKVKTAVQAIISGM